MTGVNPDRETELAAIEALVDEGELELAKERAQALTAGDDLTVVRLDLSLREGSLPPDIVLARLTQLMRKGVEIRGARELYQRASSSSYQRGVSSQAHSHPPPPVVPRDRK